MKNSTPQVFMGACLLPDNVSLPHLWHRIHSNASILASSSNESPTFSDQENVDRKDICLIEALSKCHADKWHSLCAAAGWTVYGAVALSWCEGAVLKDVWKGWEASGFPLIPKPEFERPARFINPALLPQTNKVSEMISASGSSVLAFCAMVAALGDNPLDFNLSDKGLKGASRQIAAFLKSRMLRKEERTEQEDALIRFWGDKIKGSKFDVWEDG